ncbi:annexin A3a [Anguilla rostrata]|uniref:annexin A3a n=1 Tax=Anguilla rostrata TaxID=7938 RepID=UPI0030D48414
MASVWDELDGLLDSPSSLTMETGEKGTVKSKAGFNAKEDAKALCEAIKGFGTNENILAEILARRSNAQRQEICKAYQEATGRTLVSDLEGDTAGAFERLLVGLVTPPAQYDCLEVTRAMQGPGTEESTLIEIFASRSNKQIKAFSDVYLADKGRKLTHDLKSEISGDFETALLILAEGNRDEGKTADPEKAKKDAKALYEAGEKKWGTDESKFIDILCHRSVPQLRKTLVEYKAISGKTLQQSIEGEMTGPLEDLLVAVVKCVKNVPAYLAERLRNSMKGIGTDEATLNRIMVSRSELDLLNIRAEYKKMYKCSLLSSIASDVSGVYGDCLKIICGGDD